MAYIHIKGRKPEKVNDNIGAQIKKMFEDENVSYNTVIGLKNFSIRKEDIRSVVMRDDEDTQKEKIENGTKHINDLAMEHQRNIDRLMKLSPRDRAQDTEYFAMFFVALTEQQPTEEERKEAVVAQEAYFIQNRHAIPDPAIFVPIVKRSGKGKDLGGFSAMLFEIVKKVFLSTRNRVPSWEYARQQSLLAGVEN